MLNPRFLSRYEKELDALDSNGVFYEVLEDSDHIRKLRIALKGPEGTAFDTGTYVVEVLIDMRVYPLKPPVCKLVSQIHHPNVSDDGEICVDVLKEKWAPALTLFSIAKSLENRLADPNPHHPLNTGAANDFLNDQPEFFRKNKEIRETNQAV